VPAQIVVLGGGVGGTLAANLLSRGLGREATVTVVDPIGLHVYQPGFIQVALGSTDAHHLMREERSLLRGDIELAIDAATSIDPRRGEVRLRHGDRLPFDAVIVATGARLAPELVPGLASGAEEFYSLEGALRLRERLRSFDGGRVLIGVAGIPYKCPPAPVEFSLLLDDALRHRGTRHRSEITLLSPIGRALTIQPASDLVEPILRRRGIEVTTFFNVVSVDPGCGTVESLEGERREFDLLILVPPHRGQDLVETSGLGATGSWIATDRATLQHPEHRNVFAIGDATDLPISKSGSTAHFEAPVVASRIASLVRGTAPRAMYGGRVMCFLETGHGRATALRFDYDHPPRPPAPGRRWHAAKRIFDRLYWATVPTGRISERLQEVT
jgi:sulfide:quinone oxidoreductase